jgi:RNA polymerase sigma-70 factor (ECF subfamily)
MDRLDLDQLPGWLFTVARNRAMDYWRHHALEERYSASQAPAAPVAPEPPFRSWLFENKALKPVHRLCLVLRYVHGLDREEIAQQTGLSETQVKGHLQYARQILRRELTKVAR